MHTTGPCPQNRELLHSVRDNIIISNYSLVLQDVQPFSSGVYMCVGTNSEGSTDSNPIFLDVKCKQQRDALQSVMLSRVAQVVTTLRRAVCQPARLTTTSFYRSTLPVRV